MVGAQVTQCAEMHVLATVAEIVPACRLKRARAVRPVALVSEQYAAGSSPK
jgi:hypothetical protein